MDKREFISYLGGISDIEIGIRKEAASVHENVNQHYDEHPYFYHLNKVATNVIKFGYEIITKKEDILPVLFSSYFHDSIEDARLTYNDVRKIAEKYMTEEQAFLAVEIIYALTNEKGRNRHERANDKYYAGIRDIPYAPLVKACDRLSNYNFAKETKSRMVKMYEKEMDNFIKAISPQDEYEKYPGVVPIDKRFTLTEELISALMSTE